jgi:hypothetical protein
LATGQLHNEKYRPGWEVYIRPTVQAKGSQTQIA